MAYDPLLQPANRLIRGVTPAAQLMYHFIKPTLQYALQARKLLPWKRQLTTATLDLEDAKQYMEQNPELFPDQNWGKPKSESLTQEQVKPQIPEMPTSTLGKVVRRIRTNWGVFLIGGVLVYLYMNRKNR